MAKLSSKIAIVFVPSVVAALFIFIYFLVEVLNEELTVLIAIGAIFFAYFYSPILSEVLCTACSLRSILR